MRVTAHDEIDWTIGMDVIASMAPDWRDNLGPRDVVDGAYRLYRQKNFVLEPSTRRLDIITCGPGYSDATAAFHDTVEESLILEGTCLIDGEGVFEAGDYFWRPPGWIHRSHTDVGFTALLSLEGVNPAEGSAGASRVVRGQELVGARDDSQLRTGGGRDRVVKVAIDDVTPQAFDSVRLPWTAKADSGACVRVLSSHRDTGAATMIVDLEDATTVVGTSLPGFDVHVYVIAGSLAVGGRELPSGSYLEVAQKETPLDLNAVGQVRLFVKVNVSESDDPGHRPGSSA